MEKETAIKTFYESNGIDPERVADPMDGCYDPRLAVLPQKVDQWLKSVDAADRPLFLKLLSRYCYFNRTQCLQRYARIVSALQECLDKVGIAMEEVLFVTVEAKNACASGSDNVRSDLRFRYLGVIQKEQIVATQSKLLEEDVQPYRAVLFLDDVLGSGTTMWRTIKTLRSKFPNWFDTCTLFCSSLMPTEQGVTHISENCVKYGVSLSWLYEKEWVQEPAFAYDSQEYRQMEPYEKLIGEFMIQPGKSYFMGFAQCRLLLSFYYNTPNNTLSTFWRKGVEMEPPFCRDGNQPSRPVLKELKKKKCQMAMQAYDFGADRRSWKKGG